MWVSLVRAEGRPERGGRAGGVGRAGGGGGGGVGGGVGWWRGSAGGGCGRAEGAEGAGWGASLCLLYLARRCEPLQLPAAGHTDHIDHLG
jgi:hypothetical protein